MRCLRPIHVVRSATWLAVLLAAISPNPHVAADDEAASRSAANNDVPAVRILSWAQTEEFIRKEHSRKVVLVNVWTRTCPACVEGFPDFARLQERFGRNWFACVSVNCDYDGIEGKPPEFYRDWVEKFLREQDARFDHVLLNLPLLDFLDEVRLNSTPALFVYDQSGKLVRRFDNDDAATEEEEFDIDDVATAVEKLLKSTPAPTIATD
jgi:thiol-disulfide isomerase/thioredoxin